MRAVVSPPHDSVSHIVHAAAVIATAASTALPPFAKIIAPAVAASGFPVTPIQCDAGNGGLLVAMYGLARWARRVGAKARSRRTAARFIREV
jgi:hypothetical protein